MRTCLRTEVCLVNQTELRLFQSSSVVSVQIQPRIWQPTVPDKHHFNPLNMIVLNLLIICSLSGAELMMLARGPVRLFLLLSREPSDWILRSNGYLTIPWRLSSVSATKGVRQDPRNQVAPWTVLLLWRILKDPATELPRKIIKIHKQVRLGMPVWIQHRSLNSFHWIFFSE